jgi:GTP-binding protein Era
MKSGFVAVVGRANAGKSTLINVLVGEKVAIVSPKPQTTRDRILGILTKQDYQIVFEDTPGFYKAGTILNKKMQKTARQTAKEVDLVLFVIDGHDGIKEEEFNILQGICQGEVPVIVAISKIDITSKDKIPENLVKISSIESVKEIIPVSARKGKNVNELLSLIVKYLPEGDFIFGEDVISDKSQRFMLAEIMREKILLKFDKEIPHGIAVIITEFSRRSNGIYDISLDIICEKQNHKAILIGKQGKAIKEVSAFARESMEKFLDDKVFLTTYVKVIENWRDRENYLSEFGYSSKEDI